MRASHASSRTSTGSVNVTKLYHYSMLLQWSDEDRAYLVALPEWEGHIMNWDAVTHGDTYAQAAKKGQEVLEFLVESALEEGEPVPEPRLYRAPATVKEAGIWP